MKVATKSEYATVHLWNIELKPDSFIGFFIRPDGEYQSWELVRNADGTLTLWGSEPIEFKQWEKSDADNS